MDRVTQYCIDGVGFDETMQVLRQGLRIKRLGFTLGTTLKKTKLGVPEKARKLGVNSGRMPAPNMEYHGVFKDTDKFEAKSKMDKIARILGVDRDSAIIKNLRLQANGTEASFEKVKKEIRTKEDKRKKVTVLGLARHKGPIEALNLNLEKYACEIVKTHVPKKIILCSKVTQ